MTAEAKPAAQAAGAPATRRHNKFADRLGAFVIWSIGALLTYRLLVLVFGLAETLQLAVMVFVAQGLLTLIQRGIWRNGLDTFRILALVIDFLFNLVGTLMQVYGLTGAELFGLASISGLVVNLRLVDYVIFSVASVWSLAVATASEYLWER